MRSFERVTFEINNIYHGFYVNNYILFLCELVLVSTNVILELTNFNEML